MPLAHTKNHYYRWCLPGILLLTVLVFFKTLFFEFVWDDNIYLVGQPSYQLATLGQLLLSPLNGVEYLPLRDLSYIIDYQIWGLETVWFSFVQPDFILSEYLGCLPFDARSKPHPIPG